MALDARSGLPGRRPDLIQQLNRRHFQPLAIFSRMTTVGLPSWLIRKVS